jgi:hypothetical protein
LTQIDRTAGGAVSSIASGHKSMTNEFSALDGHSAAYFGDTRDYWWNADFLALMGRRLSLDRVHDALDVGCGAPMRGAARRSAT